MILDDEKASDIVLRMKSRLLKVRKNKTGDNAPHIIQALEAEFYDCTLDFLKAAVNEFCPTANEHDRKDLVQDGFLRINRKIMTFHPKKGKLHSWMTMIVKNMCIDWMRKKRPDVDVPEQLFDRAEEPSIEQEFDRDTFGSLKAFFPFFVSDKFIFKLLAIVEKYRFKATMSCVNEVTEALKEIDVDYTEYGKPTTLVQAVIIALRGMLLTPMTDRTAIVMAYLAKNPELDVLKVLTYFFGEKMTAQMVLLMGGMQIQLPSPQQFFKPVERTR